MVTSVFTLSPTQSLPDCAVHNNHLAESINCVVFSKIYDLEKNKDAAALSKPKRSPCLFAT